MTFEVLETERLQLRKTTPVVYDYVFAHYTNDELKAFFGFTSDADVENERKRYQKGLVTFNKSFLFFHLINKETNTVIGWCGYHTWYLDHARAEIGYVLYHNTYKGKGFMTEAIPPIIAYGFTAMQLNRIEAFIGPNNQASLQLIKRLHFTQEGYLRQHYFNQGKMEDSLVFSLLKEEYDQRASTSPD